jgi:hypothetical protein
MSRHDVPAGAATADMVQRGETASNDRASNVVDAVATRPDMVAAASADSSEQLEGRHRLAARLDRGMLSTAR